MNLTINEGQLLKICTCKSLICKRLCVCPSRKVALKIKELVPFCKEANTPQSSYPFLYSIKIFWNIQEVPVKCLRRNLRWFLA